MVPGTVASVQAELARDFETFAQLLAAYIPRNWPPALYDDDARKYSLNKLQHPPHQTAWWTWYFLLRGHGKLRELIGVGGFKGPPRGGIVEIGYGVLDQYQRRGLATEAAEGLVHWALARSQVRKVAAHTLPELTASIRVLEKNGFVQKGKPEEPGAIRFELDFPRHSRPMKVA